MKCELKIYPDPILRKEAAKVDDFKMDFADIEGQMRHIMTEASGVGLAGPQVGLLKRVILVRMNPKERDDEDVRLFINPEIIESSGEYRSEEGCLSIPDVTGDVTRSARVVIRAQDIRGGHIELKAKDLVAVIFQHEIDHLNGMLFIDRLDAAQKTLIAGTLKQLRKQWKSS